MGTRDELERLARFVVEAGIEPLVDSVLPLAQARDGFARMVDGQVSREGGLHRLSRCADAPPGRGPVATDR